MRPSFPTRIVVGSHATSRRAIGPSPSGQTPAQPCIHGMGSRLRNRSAVAFCSSIDSDTICNPRAPKRCCSARIAGNSTMQSGHQVAHTSSRYTRPRSDVSLIVAPTSADATLNAGTRRPGCRTRLYPVSRSSGSRRGCEYDSPTNRATYDCADTVSDGMNSSAARTYRSKRAVVSVAAASVASNARRTSAVACGVSIRACPAAWRAAISSTRRRMMSSRSQSGAPAVNCATTSAPSAGCTWHSPSARRNRRTSCKPASSVLSRSVASAGSMGVACAAIRQRVRGWNDTMESSCATTDATG